MSTPNSWITTRQISTLDIKSPHAGTGRVPWYSTTNKSRRCKQTFLIGVAGGTASGKTSVCRAIVNNLQLPWVQILSLDCFYRPLTAQERENVKDYNFDHPNAFDWDLLSSVLTELKQGKAVKCPQYDFTTHSRKSEYTLMYGADVVLCEGILILHNPQVLKQFDVKVFVKTDDDIRLIRRIKRDIAERGRDLEGILEQYQKTVKPSYQLFCEPTQSSADIVIPRGRDNIVAIELLCDHIKNKLIEGGNINPIFYQQQDYNQYSTYSMNGQFNVPTNVLLPKENINKLHEAVNELHENDKLNGKQLLLTIKLLCNNLLTLCIKEFIPRRFKTPSPSPASTPSPQHKPIDFKSYKQYDKEQSPEVMFFDEPESSSNDDNHDDDDDDLLTIEKIAQFRLNDDDDDDDNYNNNINKKDKIDRNGSRNSIHNNKYETDEEEDQDKQDKDSDNDSKQYFDDIDNNNNNNNNNSEQICVVTIFSGGMVFGETIMQRMGNNKSFRLNYGSIHIFHESHKPSKPRFYDRKLPPNIQNQKVILVDTFIGTGNRARMALQVIIDHHVPEENICFISLVSSQNGLYNLAKVFPNVQFITTKIDQIGKSQHWETVPVTSSLVIKYCKAAGIDIIEDDSASLTMNYSF